MQGARSNDSHALFASSTFYGSHRTPPPCLNADSKILGQTKALSSTTQTTTFVGSCKRARQVWASLWTERPRPSPCALYSPSKWRKVGMPQTQAREVKQPRGNWRVVVAGAAGKKRREAAELYRRRKMCTARLQTLSPRPWSTANGSR